MTNAYVIGFSPTNLLHIRECFNEDNFEFEITGIVCGYANVIGASLIYGIEPAKRTLERIQKQYKAMTIESITSDDFDPVQLHIYEVNVGAEVQL